MDRCYGWKTCPNASIVKALKMQDESTVREFEDRAKNIRVELMEKGLNAELFWENTDERGTVSMVPTSAISGEGVPDLLFRLIELTQARMVDRLMFSRTLQCTVLEVKVIEGLGMTIDVILVNGALHEGDTICLCTPHGPVVTEIRALLTPPPSRELRVKSEYIHHKTIEGAIGLKITAPDLDKVMAGSPVMVCGPDDDLDDIKEEVCKDLADVKAMATQAKGVLVQASTLGALEALMQFLSVECDPPIPVSNVGIGPIFKRDILKANLMREKGSPEFATILAFDVTIDKDVREIADEYEVRIFTADIIYHLFDQFTRFMEDFNAKRRAEAMAIAVFPSVCKILPNNIFNNKDPIICGMECIDGVLAVGTPLCIPKNGFLNIGKVVSIEKNHSETQFLKKGESAAVKIVCDPNPGMMFGRQFDATHEVYSELTRKSIDALKEHFKEKVTKDEWRLVVKLKKVFSII